jgi:hypothetical protein
MLKSCVLPFRDVLMAVLVLSLVGGRFLAAEAGPSAPLHWAAPADIDQVMPPVRTDIPCPLPELLQGASDGVERLVHDLHRFSARERVELIEISRRGNPHKTGKNNFNYVAQINQAATGSPSVEEYRTSSSPILGAGQMIDTGTPAFALILHPYFIGDFAIVCEGLADVGNRAAWQIHFAQNLNRSNLFHVYRVENTYYPAKLKGRVWIAADNFEVLRLQTDLLEPIGQIRLQREHSDIKYGVVEFRKWNVRLWLPQTTELYMDYRGRRYQRRHSFSNFQLFNVDTGEMIKEDKSSRNQ